MGKAQFWPTLTAKMRMRSRNLLSELPGWMNWLERRWPMQDHTPPPHYTLRPAKMIRWMCRRDMRRVRSLWADDELRNIVRAPYLHAIVRIYTSMSRLIWPAVLAALVASGASLLAIMHTLSQVDTITAGALLKRAFDPETTMETAGVFIGAVLGFLGLVFIFHPRRPFVYYYIVSPLVAAGGLVGIFYWSDTIGGSIVVLTESGLVAYGLVTSFFGLYFGCAFVAALWILSRLRKRETDSLLIRHLVRLLRRCEASKRSWCRLNFRLGLSRDIVRIADLIEGPLRQRFTISGGATGLVDNEFRKIAANFRSKMFQIASAGTSSRSEVTTAVRRATLAVANGAWDALDRVEVLSPARRSMYHWALIALRWFIVAVGPGLGVYVIQQTAWKLQPPADSFAALAVVGWFLISCFSAVDPLYKDKIASVKEIVSLFSRGRP